MLDLERKFNWLSIVFHLQESVIPVIWHRVLGVMLFSVIVNLAYHQGWPVSYNFGGLILHILGFGKDAVLGEL